MAAGKTLLPKRSAREGGQLISLMSLKNTRVPSFLSGSLWPWQRSKRTVYTLIGLFSEGINSESHCQASLKKTNMLHSDLEHHVAWS